MRTAIRLIVLTTCLGLFGWFVVEAGPEEILRSLVRLGPYAPLVAMPYVFVYLFDTLGWQYAFHRADAHVLGFWRLVTIRMAGEAVNNVVPSAYVGGEPVKVYLAHKHGLRRMAGASSVVVAKTTMTISQVLFIALAALAALATVPPGSPLYRGLVAVLAMASGIVVMLLWIQRRGMFTTLGTGARRLGLRRDLVDRHWAHLEHLDGQIVRFYREEKLRFALSTGFHLAGWVVGFLEIWLICWLLGVPIAWTEAFALEAFAAVAKAIGLFSPGSLGVQELGIAWLFRAFGLPATLGASYAILRRAREVFFASLGGALLLAAEGNPSQVLSRVRTEAQEPS